MIGGLADWFAVVALFRHPLGLPIPHTAVIIERKRQFGETLGDFIQTSFLTPDAVVERVRAAAVGDRVAAWLADPANADRLAGHLLDAGVQAVDLLEDEEVHDVIERRRARPPRAASIVPMAGRALGALTREGRHEEVVDAGAPRARPLPRRAPRRLQSRFRAQAPWWLPGAVEDRIFERLLDGARAVARRDGRRPRARPAPPARRPHPALRRRAPDLARAAGQRGEQLPRDLLEQPELRTWVAALWTDAKAHLRAQAATTAPRCGNSWRPPSPPPASACSPSRRYEPRSTTPPTRAPATWWTTSAARSASSSRPTIDRWDGEETSRPPRAPPRPRPPVHPHQRHRRRRPRRLRAPRHLPGPGLNLPRSVSLHNRYPVLGGHRSGGPQ